MEKDTIKNSIKFVDIEQTKIVVKNPWLIFFIFSFAYIALTYVTLAGQDMITHLTKGKQGWKVYLIIAGILMGVLYLIGKYTNITLLEFEQL